MRLSGITLPSVSAVKRIAGAAMTSRKTVVHRALDGTRIAVESALDLTRPYTSVARVATTRQLHELTSGGLSDGQEAAKEVIGVSRLTEEFSFQRGTLRIGHATRRDRAIGLTERLLAAVWQGREHSIVTHLYYARTADAIAFYNQFTITEYDDGVVITPKDVRRLAYTEPARIVKEIPGVGLLEMTRLNRQSARVLPNWRGTAVKGGELFRDTQGDGSDYFLLATPSALVTVLPGAASEPRQAPARLADLTVRTLN
jgi:hypothetical protein